MNVPNIPLKELEKEQQDKQRKKKKGNNQDKNRLKEEGSVPWRGSTKPQLGHW